MNPTPEILVHTQAILALQRKLGGLDALEVLIHIGIGDHLIDVHSTTPHPG